MIDPIFVVEPTFVEWTSQMLEKNTLTVYIDKSMKPMKDFTKELVKATDWMLDIKFKFVKKEKKADIRFYQQNVIDDDSSVLGYAEYCSSNSNSYWNIRVQNFIMNDIKSWVILHEFGHTLGLEHPFDAYDGDYYQTLDPWGDTSATTNDTVMAYNMVEPLPKIWRTSDRDALTGTWNK